MDSQLVRELVLIIILLALSGFFSSAETALVAVKKFRLRDLVEEGNKLAKIALNVINDQPKMLSAILIGNNLVNTYLASLASMVAYRFGGYAVSLVTFLITFLILVFGEITPKTLATADPERLALWYAPIISFLMKILTPIIWFINLFSSMILRLFGVHTQREGFSITESELHTILDVSHEQGVIETEEHNMIRNVFDFKEAKASQIMVPRVHATMIDVN
ncbi:MAG: CNNM domain-containing protein, partial [Allobaculum sp.]|nr:CNNM domain-containing protein [Allobaculum sp.]